ncbi:MAG TPA: hypothetical protein VN704_02915, partial [Verrucomicrobiae bacterium]|nr:hypothetical protein [Verrucomicrobiae bacterium]
PIQWPIHFSDNEKLSYNKFTILHIHPEYINIYIRVQFMWMLVDVQIINLEKGFRYDVFYI